MSSSIFLFVFMLISVNCEARREHVITGHTMGTTFQVRVITGRYEFMEDLAEEISKRLAKINRSMSTYIEVSEISRFNRFGEVNRPFAVSEDFLGVMQAGKKIFELSGGAWDATVAPLVDLWGFGPSWKKNPELPPSAELRSVMQKIGFDKIDILPSGDLVKRDAGVSLDFGSIAKGFGVDQVADLLQSQGYRNFLVEIGGEVFASGVRSDGQPWQVGVNKPLPSASADAVYKAFSLTGAALATSGDYRNFFVLEGVRYSHVIDPRTGYPVSNGVVSASIIAPDCTLADGLATAVMVMGAEKGIELINRIEGVEGLIIVARPSGRLVDYASAGL